MIKEIHINSAISNYPDDFGLEKLKNEIEGIDEFRLNLNSGGGDVDEAKAMYDFLRTSGKTIHTHINGNCHSAAIMILLAAPAENRSVTPLTTCMIHKVSAWIAGDMTAESAVEIAVRLTDSQNMIARIYADRTNLTIEEAQTIMNEELERDANYLLANGFISKIIEYNTNKKNEKMSTTKTRLENLVSKFLKKNFVFKDAEGATLFETPAESAEIAVGDAATPDGTFTLPDGRVVTILDGKITAIETPSGDDSMEDLLNLIEQMGEAITSLQKEVAELKVKNMKVSNKLIQPPLGQRMDANANKEDKDYAAKMAATNEKFGKIGGKA